MNNLEMNQMEMLSGGINQRNCMVLGGFIVIGAITGFASVGWGWGIAAAAALTAASGDCF